MDALVEVHDEVEMERALLLDHDLIGVNNRNLKTFEVDLATTEQLADEVPESILLVSESGIKSPADAQRVLDAENTTKHPMIVRANWTVNNTQSPLT